MRTPKAKFKSFLRWLANSNPLTRSLYKWRYERHLERVVTLDCEQNGGQAIFKKEIVEIREGDKSILINRKHAIYAGTIVKSFDLFFSAVKPAIEDRRFVVDYSKPKLHTLSNGLEFEFYSFPEQIGIIDDYLAWYKPKPGDTVFDLGGNWGLSAYFFSNLVGPEGRVICFEPDPNNLIYLRKNIDRHKLENVTVVPVAVGAADGTAQFSSEGTIGSSMMSVLGRESAGKVITVSVISLTKAFEKFGVPDFCKIDIEGAEVEVLEAAIETLSSIKTKFVLDTGHVVNGETTDKRIESIFRRANYETRTCDKHGLITFARPA